MLNVTKIVILKIIPQWKDLSRLLVWMKLLYVGGIESDSRNKTEICEKVFLKWLNSNHGPTPKTWNTLICCIKHIDEFAAAAEKIEDKLCSTILCHSM